MKVTADQIRAARALLHLDQAELAGRAKVSVVTIRRIEAIEGGEQVSPATLARVRAVLERGGAEFIPGGVRRHTAGRADAEERFNKLRAISMQSARRLRDRELLTDADLYGEDGLPA